ncbi:MAG: hypothetical protein ACE5KM_12145 [Planctomycetaceae bacterium]
MKASEKQSICKKLVTALKKRYKSPVPKTDDSVVDLMLFGVCLENQPVGEAQAALERLMTDFHDYNELRVSSVTELEAAFGGAEQSEYRAMRVRCILQDVFERRGLNVAEDEHYRFDLETLRRMTLDSATKLLAKFRHLSPFVTTFTLQAALGAHLVPVDERLRDAAVWLGLVPVGSTPADASDALKPAVRKADVARFSHLLRCLATDARLVKTIAAALKKPPEGGFDATTAVTRLDELYRAATKKRKTAKRKPTARASRTKTRKTAAKRTATKKKAAKRKTSKPATRKKKTKTKRSKARR